ncbi:dolichyl-diphosphooligosaccharide--protein glycosyltransferase 48 [Musa troglodytarum]|uniref:Dolichyl-diphosphooligosaccharide--protein glycosyltransferase 48 kDa subunit n=1 Tax=Musa troglodytarum TaxID=320322 RepID=A0A9E7JCJ7_9LILI|nr:dolichyl-diphosphooligosaccharide--protein glycosyltransferase 48 [Musa troglodytarum]
MAKLYPAPLSAIVLVLLASIICLRCDAFSADRLTDRWLLVLVDDLADRSSRSRFFSSLQSRASELDFKLADDSSLALLRYGQYLYDSLILFSQSVQRFGGSLDLVAVLDFVDAGHDLILAADSSASDLMREIATDCGDPTAMVVDHTNYAVSEAEGDHTLTASDDFIKSDVILGDKMIEVLKVLSTSPAAYSANPSAKLSWPPSLTRSAISLVSVVQARNNACVLIAGSLDMFSNQHEKSGNEQFVTEISKWVFHERGHLKAVNLHHHKVGETNEPSMYRINDDLEYSVEIYEWSGSSWEPYLADDVQVQFYMMSPYVLKTLATDQKDFSYSPFFTSATSRCDRRAEIIYGVVCSTRAREDEEKKDDPVHGDRSTQASQDDDDDGASTTEPTHLATAIAIAIADGEALGRVTFIVPKQANMVVASCWSLRNVNSFLVQQQAVAASWNDIGTERPMRKRSDR